MVTNGELFEDYEEPDDYEFPFWAYPITFLVLTIVFLLIFWFIDPILSSSPHPTSLLIFGIFGILGTLYLHESLHYIASGILELQPDFCWPNSVDNNAEIIPRGKIVATLLAPQILSFVYIVLLWVVSRPILTYVLLFTLASNIVDSYKDVAKALRFLIWPKGTIIVSNDEYDSILIPKN